ncbi:hypothetical protein UlMin_031918 [Ulmus minor]
MDCSLSPHKSPGVAFNLKPRTAIRGFAPKLGVSFRTGRRFRALTVVAVAGAGHCEFSSLNSPLEPRTPAGKDLVSVLQNHPQLFKIAVDDELKLLADDRAGAIDRMNLSADSPWACLHRRIAQLKEKECQIAVEDIMYLLIFQKFSEIKVHLVPKLSRCIYNGRLEIWPTKDWELESIYSFEVLEIVREHVAAVIGLRVNSSITENWAMTEIKRSVLSRVYVASILYGYFLKSALSRLHLEQCLSVESRDLHLKQKSSLKFQEMCSHGIKDLLLGHVGSMESKSCGQGSSRQEKKSESFRCYVMGFDPETLQRCAKLKSQEAMNLIESHSLALFGNEKTGSMETDEVISTSFSTLRRLVLEAVAFGSFLWDTEECINNVYKLKEN